MKCISWRSKTSIPNPNLGKIGASVGLLFLLYYLPFLFGPAHTHLTVHDNLDSGFVFNRLVGRLYLNQAETKEQMLGGNIPLSLMVRTTCPLALINLLRNDFTAYALNDLLVRIVAFAGMYCLTRRANAPPLWAALAASLFAFSISYVLFLLSVAAIPAVVYLTQRIEDKTATVWHSVALFLLGWNSELVMSGVFLVLALPAIRHFIFGPRHGQLLTRAYLPFTAGLLAGSAGLVLSRFQHIRLQRAEAVFQGNDWLGSVRVFFANQFPIRHWDFYHVSMPLAVLYVAALAGCLASRSKRSAQIIALILWIHVFYAAVHTNCVAALRNRIGGLFLEFQFDRFYFLVSSLIILAWLLSAQNAGKTLRRTLFAGGAIQLAVVFFQAPHIHGAIRGDAEPTFASYFKHADYAQVRAAVGDDKTLSVGLDPMVAVENGLRAIDGYYSAYPARYKHLFRRVIARQLEASGRTHYFDDWGNRVYTFADDPANVRLDFCAARDIGALYVISRFPLNDSALRFKVRTEPNHLCVYRIASCAYPD